ncbi:MAG TPA: hypothetical protein VGW38_09645 [Chloroflexota bacterium]|nr:hypothetical protein [Chloroflexota bacterium]
MRPLTPVAAADHGTLPPEFPLACGSVYNGQVQQYMNDAINSILASTTGTATPLKDAARQINACLAASVK